MLGVRSRVRERASGVFIPGNAMQLFSRIETAHRLGVSVDTVERLYNGGRLKPCRIGRRVLFSEEAINEFIRECPVRP